MKKLLISTLFIFITIICTCCNNDTNIATSSNHSNTQIEHVEEASAPVIVYITATGTKYHKENCQYLKYSKCRTLLEDAVTAYYKPCSVCNP